MAEPGSDLGFGPLLLGVVGVGGLIGGFAYRVQQAKKTLVKSGLKPPPNAARDAALALAIASGITFTAAVAVVQLTKSVLQVDTMPEFSAKLKEIIPKKVETFTTALGIPPRAEATKKADQAPPTDLPSLFGESTKKDA